MRTASSLGRPPRRIPAVASVLLATLALAVGLTWVIGRTLTDRQQWSQYLFWLPTWVYFGVAVVLLALSVSLAWMAVVRRGKFKRWPGRFLRGAAMMLSGAMMLWAAFVECRIHALIGRQRAMASAAPEGGLRILFWNPSSFLGIDLATPMLSIPSDLAIVDNPPWDRQMSPLADGYDNCVSLVLQPNFVVLSRFPIKRFAVTTLGLRGREQVPSEPGGLSGIGETPTGNIDPGRAMFLEVDTTASLGRPVVVWVLDLPSDQRLARRDMMDSAAQAIAAWEGQAMKPLLGGKWAIIPEPVKGFPEPDIVLGDFNTPRGSASLQRLAPGMSNAYDQGGAGYTASFPRGWPLLHLDQVLVAPWLRAQDYRVLDPGIARHKMQWTRLTAR